MIVLATLIGSNAPLATSNDASTEFIPETPISFLKPPPMRTLYY
jgi:hypothetical protein